MCSYITVLKFYLITMKQNLIISFIAISLLTFVAAEDCDKCVRKNKCSAYGKLSKQEQDAWQINHPCASPIYREYSSLFGFAPIATGDYVCCSAAIQELAISNRRPVYDNFDNQNNYDDPNSGYNYPNSQSLNGFDFGSNKRNPRSWGSDNNNGYADYNNYQPEVNQPPKNYFHTNNNPYVTSSPFFLVNGNGNGGYQEQCPVTSFPPKPETGCCGREASDADRIIDRPIPPSYYDNDPWTTHNQNSYEAWPSWTHKLPTYRNPFKRLARSAEVTLPAVTVGDRIAGGRETELEQFPWTVLLQITFDFGDKRAAFNCGGSLISNRYVLTAGHCVYDKLGKMTDIDIYLSEYDKRTFPKDCKIVLGQGKKCIENIVMKAEDVVLHPHYDDKRLNNDIALIRLRGFAPYTDYIRPICLPSIDIDTPEFFNLRLAVSGWGRNGRYRSDVKQSTIVNLITQEKCKQFYPSLSLRQMCAAGYTGEDTCKGDSGGPLMTVYGGKYEVVGVVSGKRADSPCGTSVPSLYTNVYHYRDWILNNMKD